MYLQSITHKGFKTCATIRRVTSPPKIKQQTTAIPDTLIPQCPMAKTLKAAKAFTPERKVGSELLGRPFEEIPGPKGLPFIGTLLEYLKKDGLSFSKTFEAFHKRSLVYGPIFREQMTTRRIVVISDPDEYDKVIKADGRLPIRPTLEPLVHYSLKRQVKLDFGNMQGEEWHRQRAVLSRKMLVPQEIRQYCSPMDDIANDVISRLDLMRQSVNGEVHDLEMELFKWAM